MPANETDDRDASGDGWTDPACEHLRRVREALAGYAEYAGLTVADVLVPAMPEETRRHASGRVMVELLGALAPVPRDAADGGSAPEPASVPLLVCALQHPETGARIALLAAAASMP
jgi:hypothetical protein